jgi:hypothetical protein
MLPRLVLLSAVLVTMSALSQDAVGQDPPPDELLQRVQRLEQRLVDVESQATDLRSLVEENAKQIGALADVVAENRSLIARLRSEDDAHTTTLNEHGEMLQQIAARDDGGNYYLRLDATVNKSPQARQSLSSAIRRTIPMDGSLFIRNEMGSDQDVLVDGEQHRVLAGATLRLKVPVGTVSTRLPGQDSVNWHVGLPEYEQRVVIRPRRTASRSTQWIPVVPPIYVDPWFWDGYVASW